MALKSQWAKVVPSFAAVVKSLRVDINPFKGGLLTSPKGFSLRYPEGWAVASAERLAHWPSSQKPAAFLVGPPDQGGINPNLAVMVTPQKLPMDDKDPDFAKKFAKGYVQAFEKTYAQAGLTISNVEGIRMFAGKLPALSVTFDSHLLQDRQDGTPVARHRPGKDAGLPDPLQRQLAGVGQGPARLQEDAQQPENRPGRGPVSGGVTRKSRWAAWPPWESPRCRRGSCRTAVSSVKSTPPALAIRTLRPMRQFLSMIAPSMCVPPPTPSGGRPLLLPAAISSGAS